MTNSNTVIGIDLISTDRDGGIYGLYTSLDGGSNWQKLTQSRTIFTLLEFAKMNYNSDTPMVIPQTIQQLIQYELISVRETNAILAQQKSAEKNKNWYRRFLNWLRKCQ